MLSEKEIAFIQKWEKNREVYGGFKSKISRGLPMAFVFGLPILLFILAVYLYFPEWYYRISNRLSGALLTIVIAVMIAVLFFSYFRMHFLWEQNEQLYKELLHKQKKEDAASLSKNGS
jgi:glucan phosphoethanolaminetransferase (alkaline phosphatase superfamily)